MKRIPNQVYFMLFSSREGQDVLADMKLVAKTKMLQKDKNGRVDPFAAMHAAGQRDFIDDIERRIEDGQLVG